MNADEVSSIPATCDGQPHDRDEHPRRGPRSIRRELRRARRSIRQEPRRGRARSLTTRDEVRARSLTSCDEVRARSLTSCDEVPARSLTTRDEVPTRSLATRVEVRTRIVTARNEWPRDPSRPMRSALERSLNATPRLPPREWCVTRCALATTSLARQTEPSGARRETFATQVPSDSIGCGTIHSEDSVGA